jgi:hypothetical protein
MLGDGSEWVQNARAAGGMAFIKRGGSHPVKLTEIPPQQRAPIPQGLEPSCHEWLPALAGRFDAPVTAFEAIATDYPVFRIDPAA